MASKGDMVAELKSQGLDIADIEAQMRDLARSLVTAASFQARVHCLERLAERAQARQQPETPERLLCCTDWELAKKPSSVWAGLAPGAGRRARQMPRKVARGQLLP